jgi:hypothetical protein
MDQRLGSGVDHLEMGSAASHAASSSKSTTYDATVKHDFNMIRHLIPNSCKLFIKKWAEL